MTWVVWSALAAMGGAVLRAVWAGLGPPWHWPGLLARPLATAWHGRRERRRPVVGAGVPDPFEVLRMQHRLTLIAEELRVLTDADADLVYYARAHRIHTRRSAYDQLLAEACRMAGVQTEHAAREDGICRSEDERFLAETELAARGWHW